MQRVVKDTIDDIFKPGKTSPGLIQVVSLVLLLASSKNRYAANKN